MNPTPTPNGPPAKRDLTHLRRSLKRSDRNLILALEKAIDDPATPNEMREEYREALGGVAMDYIDILTPKEEREYLAKIDPAELLTDEEWEEFINRQR